MMLFWAIVVASIVAGEETRHDGIDECTETRSIRGWTVLVNAEFLRQRSELATQTLELLDQHLYSVTRVVPEPSLSKLKQVPIWVEENEPHHPCMAYHPDARWLGDHQMDPRKARGVEIANARAFLTWTHDQPSMVLHELAHAFHHQFLPGSFDNPVILARYEEAIKAKLYDRVLTIRGQHQRHYASTSVQEFFAEATEAYFGTNDFYPFVRSELNSHDPATFKLMQRVWGK